MSHTERSANKKFEFIDLDKIFQPRQNWTRSMCSRSMSCTERCKGTTSDLTSFRQNFLNINKIGQKTSAAAPCPVQSGTIAKFFLFYLINQNFLNLTRIEQKACVAILCLTWSGIITKNPTLKNFDKNCRIGQKVT